MKNLFKSITLGLVVIGTTLSSKAQFGGFPDTTGSPAGQAGGTNLPTANAVSLLTTNRAEIYSISLLSTNGGFIYFYDANNLASPYYGTNYVQTNPVITSQWYYTNVVSSFVGYNGYTNWYTNNGVFTYYSTNSLGATNGLTPAGVFAFQPNIVATYNVSMLNEQGTTVLPTVANVGLTYFYRPAK